MLRIGPRTEVEILEDILKRVKVLEETASRRALPAGYSFSLDTSTNVLSLIRTSDGASVVLL